MPAAAVATGLLPGFQSQDEALRDAAAAGVDLEDVVDQLELPVDAIQARLAQLGLALAATEDEPSLFPDLGRSRGRVGP